MWLEIFHSLLQSSCIYLIERVMSCRWMVILHNLSVGKQVENYYSYYTIEMFSSFSLKLIYVIMYVIKLLNLWLFSIFLKFILYWRRVDLQCCVTFCCITVIQFQFSSVAQSCPTLCDPMDCSRSGFPVNHWLLELTQTHVQSSWWCHPAISFSVTPFSSCLQSSPALGSFQMSQFFTLGGQGIGVSSSASVLPRNILPRNIQDWFPLGWTCWISLQSKGLSRVFFNSLALSFLDSPTLTSIHDYWKNHSFD